jgi:hypothetical protein
MVTVLVDAAQLIDCECVTRVRRKSDIGSAGTVPQLDEDWEAKDVLIAAHFVGQQRRELWLGRSVLVV